MRRLGEILLILFPVLGIIVALAIVGHIGPGSSWLINVALAKLTLIGAGGLMGAGAVAIASTIVNDQRGSPPTPSRTTEKWNRVAKIEHSSSYH